jgi:hypothetical protein
MTERQSPLVRALYSERFTVRHETFNPAYPDSAEYWEVLDGERVLISGIISERQARNDALNLMHGYEMALEKIREVIK